MTPTRDKNTFLMHTFGHRITFDPHLAEDEASNHIVQNLYETPFVQQANEEGFEFVSSLCDADSTWHDSTIVLHLRKGMRDHAGNELTIHDVLFSFVRSLVLASDTSPMGEIASLIWGAEKRGDVIAKCREINRLKDLVEVVEDDNRLVFRLPVDFGPTKAILASRVYIFARNWAASMGDWDGDWDTVDTLVNVAARGGLGFRACGTGPYRLVEHENDRTVLERHDDYWGTPANFRQVILDRTDDPVERRDLLITNEVDFAACTREVTEELGLHTNVTVYDHLPELNVNPFAGFTFEIAGATNQFIGSGKLDGNGIPANFFSDVLVRRACAAAFDYDYFLHNGLAGVGQRALGPVPSRLDPGAWDEQLLAQAPRMDLDAARSYWAEAWDGRLQEKGCRFTIVTHAGNVERVFAAHLLADGLRQIRQNVRVDVLPVEWSEYRELIKKRMAPIFWIGVQADYGDPHSLARCLTHSQGLAASWQGFRFEQFDVLIQRGVEEADPVERDAIYRKLNAMTLDLVPQLYTYERDRFIVLNSSVGGFRFNPFRYSVVDYRDLYRRTS